MKAKNHTKSVIGLVFKILFSFGNNDWRQDQKGNQVRQGHQGIDDIRNNPDHIQLDKSSQQDHDYKDHTVKPDKTNTKEKFKTALSVVIPAENCRKGKENQKYGQKSRPKM